MSWEFVKIGDLCKTGAGGTPLKSKKEFYIGGTIPWLLSGEVAQGEIFSSKKFITQEGLENSSAKLFPVNTVLVAMYGATAGQVGILRFEAATNQAVCGIYPNDRFLPEFVYYSILFKQKELIGKATGNAQPNISQIKIKNTEIPLPSLKEQKRIVAILDKAFAGIDTAIANTEKNLANARELFESYLNEVFARKGDGLVEQTLSDVCQIKPPKKQAKELLSETDLISFVPMSDLGIRQKEIYLKEERPLGKVIGSYTYFAENDVLLAKITPCFENGKLGIARGLTNGIGFGSSEYVVFRSNGKVDPEYLFYFLSQNSFRDEGTKVMTGAVGHKRVPKEFIENYLIPLPSLIEQKSIVAKLDSLNTEVKRLESIYQQKLGSLKELKQSLLQKAFSGELTSENNQQPGV